MQKQRVDLYRLVHKAIRRSLFEFSVELGATDAAEIDSRLALAWAGLVRLLREHAEHEERFIHPLLARAGSQFRAQREEEHRQGEAAVNALEESWAALPESAGAFYLGFNRFIGEYLAHLDAEERESMRELQSRYSDEELGAVMQPFQASRSEIERRRDLELMWPALTPAERAAFPSPFPSP